MYYTMALRKEKKDFLSDNVINQYYRAEKSLNILKYSEDNSEKTLKHIRDNRYTTLIFREIYSRNMFHDTCGSPSRFSADATHITYYSSSRRRRKYARRVKGIKITRE